MFGPRGTGKSTWLAQVFPGALRLDLLAPDVLRAYLARPERLRERIAATPTTPDTDTTTTVVIDEIQKARKLRHGAATLAAYAGLYLREEVQAEALVRQIGDFSRFLEVISFSQASQLNLAALAREAEIPRKRAEGYLSILEDLLLAFQLPVFQRRAQRQLVQHQKFFYFDVGVYRSLRPRGPLDAPEEIDGMALETLVAQHLRAFCQLRRRGETLSFSLEPLCIDGSCRCP
ncbi:MAG: DUF4143 domain-containing protein [Cyanobacteriota bacterium]|nr:DUF4143 domain-containing protein [Cyanobacteriota bacterium]